MYSAELFQIKNVKKDTGENRVKRTDEELLAELVKGDETCFVELMQRYMDPICSFAFRFVGNYDDAVDITQETFVRVYRFSHTYNSDVRFTTWLYTIAANLCRSELRRYRRKYGVSFSEMNSGTDDSAEWEVADTTYSPDERIDSDHIAQQVQSALMKLPAAYREMVILRDIQQLSYEEIAVIAKVELGTVKSRINRGRKKLQEQLQGLYVEVFGSSGEKA